MEEYLAETLQAMEPEKFAELLDVCRKYKGETQSIPDDVIEQIYEETKDTLLNDAHFAQYLPYGSNEGIKALKRMIGIIFSEQ